MDGVKTAITPIGDAMISVPVTAGTHTRFAALLPEGLCGRGVCYNWRSAVAHRFGGDRT